MMMIEEREKGRLESFRLTEAIHSYGINVRYIGVLRKHITELDCRTFLLVEVCFICTSFISFDINFSLLIHFNNFFSLLIGAILLEKQ